MFANSKNLNVTVIFLLIGLISIYFADLSIYSLNSKDELLNFFSSITKIDLSSIPSLADAFFTTIAIAIVAIFVSSFIGFFLSIYFSFYPLRIALSFTRAIHEIFWALIFLQIFGLNTLSALLAIIIPYSAILGKVYAEILEENDNFVKELRGVKRISYFIYTKLPDALPHLISYTLYRFECALRSTTILGFVGITTLGYYLSSSFMQGYYAEVWLILIIFYIIVASIRFWFTKYSSPFLFIASFFYLEDFSGFNFDNLIRFITIDIVPTPIKKDFTYDASFEWFYNLFTLEIIPGVFNTIVLTQISLIATALLALIFFPIISKSFVNKPSRIGGHVLLIILRSTPEYVLAYLFLQMFGPSMLPAVLALMLHNGAIISHLMGHHTNELKYRDDVTSRKIELYSYEVVPRVYSSFLAFLFYRWEIIMRESAILGLLGVATLGFYIDSAFADLRLDKVFILLLVTALLNILVDIISKKVREYLKTNETITSCGCSLK